VAVHYPAAAEEAHFDATPAVEKALSWVRPLGARSFVGTESRLDTIFALLRQIVYGAEDDPEVRLAELRRRRQEIDEEIAEVEGAMSRCSSPQLREHGTPPLTFEIDGTAPAVVLPMDRPLYTPGDPYARRQSGRAGRRIGRPGSSQVGLPELLPAPTDV
jgi:hypothetical protein